MQTEISTAPVRPQVIPELTTGLDPLLPVPNEAKLVELHQEQIGRRDLTGVTAGQLAKAAEPLAHHGPILLSVLKAADRAAGTAAMQLLPAAQQRLLVDMAEREQRQCSYGCRAHSPNNLPLQAESLRFITYNVWGMPHLLSIGTSGTLTPAVRLKQIAAQLQEEDYGVVALQEMWSRGSLPISQLPNYPYRADDGKPWGLFRCSGLVTLSKYPIEQSEFLPFKDRPGVEGFARKGVLFTRLMLPGDERLDVYNLHLSADHGFPAGWLCSLQRSLDSRTSQLAQLKNWIEERTVPGVPRVVLGDFNVDEQIHPSQYAQIVTEIGDDVYRLRYTAAEAGQGGGVRPETVRGHTIDPVNNPWFNGREPRSKRLDYALVKGFDETRTAVSTRVAFSRPALSDHYGVELTLLRLEHSETQHAF